MGRKSRLKAKFRAAARLAQGAPAQPMYQARPVAEPKAAAPVIEKAIQSTQATRYQYILPELRLIGIISGALFLILIILTFILS